MRGAAENVLCLFQDAFVAAHAEGIGLGGLRVDLLHRLRERFGGRVETFS
jgi:hypothetical protein